MKVVSMKSRTGRLRFLSVRHVCVMLAMIMCVTYVAAFFSFRREVYVSVSDYSRTIKGYKIGKYGSKEAYDFFLPMIYLTGGLPAETLNAPEQVRNKALKSRPLYVFIQ